MAPVRTWLRIYDDVLLQARHKYAAALARLIAPTALPFCAQRWNVRHLRGLRPDDLCDDVAGRTFIVTGPTRHA